MNTFEEKAGTIDYHTPDYSWSQNIEEVNVTVNVPEGTRGKDLEVQIKTDSLKVKLKGQPKAYIDGILWSKVKTKDCLWTLEDNKVVSLCLPKVTSHESWKALIKGEHEVDPFTSEKMDKKMLLERFQKENPGFDFSGAEFSGQVPKDGKNFMKFD